MNFIFMGYRACGKTTVGRIMAKKLQRPFFDTDHLVQERTGKTIREIVESRGWEAFRESERAVIAEIAGLDGCIIALGGGAVLDQRNVEKLKRKGFFFWLSADEGTIRERLLKGQASDAQRPPLSGTDASAEIAAVLKARTDIYRQLADRIVDASRRTVEEIAAEIDDFLKIRNGDHGPSSQLFAGHEKLTR
jgi:shikimate kinase